jgi:hypothetical protein
MTEFIEYEKPAQCSLHILKMKPHILKMKPHIAEILEKRGRATIRKIHNIPMNNHLKLFA